ncbi:hypothetical protein [Arthrobacter sedimenti]|uniref:hypothetical protein n=1 Tax=Arthrobacter sedimenti TaxID=2694931 RepID=UPI002D7EF674|nr:hypothetical protein [Arthrobacter sedimenti]
MSATAPGATTAQRFPARGVPVQLAKEGLGERGTPWWEQSEAERAARWTAALKELDALHPKRPDPSKSQGPDGRPGRTSAGAGSPPQDDAPHRRPGDG